MNDYSLPSYIELLFIHNQFLIRRQPRLVNFVFMQVLNSDADIVTKCCSNGKNYPKPVLDVVAFDNLIWHWHVLKLILDHAHHVVILKAEQPMSNI